MAAVFFAALLGLVAVQNAVALVVRQTISPLATPQIDQYTPYTYFAAAAYCSPSTTYPLWDCGVKCNNTSTFKPVASGGDGDDIQYWYVGYDPALHTVIVAHQGTDIYDFFALLTDLDIILEYLDSTLFPGLPSNIFVHAGFQAEQAKTAYQVLSAVEDAMLQYKTTSVTVVGHSLGAALSLLDLVFLPLYLPPGTTVNAILYGLPRVGNQAFADYVDANLAVTHINNLKDPIPTLPPMFMDYVHPNGEVHIRESGEWAACPGQDNPSTECIVGDVPDIFVGDLSNHDGPYNGIEMSCNH